MRVKWDNRTCVSVAAEYCLNQAGISFLWREWDARLRRLRAVCTSGQLINTLETTALIDLAEPGEVDEGHVGVFP